MSEFGVWGSVKNESSKAIVCITPSFRGEKVDKRAMKRERERERGKKRIQKERMIQRGIIDILSSGLWEK